MTKTKQNQVETFSVEEIELLAISLTEDEFDTIKILLALHEPLSTWKVQAQLILGRLRSYFDQRTSKLSDELGSLQTRMELKSTGRIMPKITKEDEEKLMKAYSEVANKSMSLRNYGPSTSTRELIKFSKENKIPPVSFSRVKKILEFLYEKGLVQKRNDSHRKNVQILWYISPTFVNAWRKRRDDVQKSPVDVSSLHPRLKEFLFLDSRDGSIRADPWPV